MAFVYVEYSKQMCELFYSAHTFLGGCTVNRFEKKSQSATLLHNRARLTITYKFKLTKKCTKLPIPHIPTFLFSWRYFIFSFRCFGCDYE